ncbi:MAG: hypothetical protein ABIM19_03820 [candidate division WOR-3 bacterium]
MASRAMRNPKEKPKDVDEIIGAHGALTGGRVGTPLGKGGALTRAGVILFAATTGAFVEERDEEAAPLILTGATSNRLNSLFENANKKLNNAGAHKTNMLYLNLGIPWILNRSRWLRFSNNRFQTSLERLVETIGQIAYRGSSRLDLWRLWVGKHG